MKTVVALHSPTDEGRKPRLTGANAERSNQLAASRHIFIDFVTSIWCGAIVGCIGAAIVPPFSEDRS
jgi:hypothetical protein